MEQTTDSTNQVDAVVTAIEVIEALEELDGAGVTEVADHLGVHKSTVYVHLNTLKHNDFVVCEDGTYRLSYRLLELGAATIERSELYEHARPHVDALAEETGLLVNLMVEERGYGVYLASVSGSESINLRATRGRHAYLHTTALGKAILAHMDDDRVEAILDRHGLPRTTDRTITDPALFREKLDEIREEGIAYDNEEHMPGVRCVASPIQYANDEVLGAISISGPNRLVEHRSMAELTDELKDAVSVIELNVKYPD